MRIGKDYFSTRAAPITDAARNPISGEAADGVGFVFVDIENRIELGDL